MKNGLKYADLNTRAKIKCLDIYVNVVCPYENFDDDVGLEDVEYNIECTLETGLFTIDSDGNWYIEYTEAIREAKDIAIKALQDEDNIKIK